MNPTAFNMFGIEIKWYGIMIATGLMLGILAAKYTCKIRKADYDTFLNMLLVSVPICIIGARLYYVVFEFEYYRNHLGEMFNIRHGGLAIHGGIIFGVIAAIIYTYCKKINFFQYADAAVPSLILAQAVGRWGNFFNQEAHGGPVTKQFISNFPQFIQKGMLINGEYYHPTFLYESLWDILVFIILIIIIKKIGSYGIALFLYIGLYSLGRFFIEGLRTDSLMLGSFRIAQLVSIGGIFLSIAACIFYYYRAKHKIL